MLENRCKRRSMPSSFGKWFTIYKRYPSVEWKRRSWTSPDETSGRTPDFYGHLRVVFGFNLHLRFFLSRGNLNDGPQGRTLIESFGDTYRGSHLQWIRRMREVKQGKLLSNTPWFQLFRRGLIAENLGITINDYTNVAATSNVSSLELKGSDVFVWGMINSTYASSDLSISSITLAHSVNTP